MKYFISIFMLVFVLCGELNAQFTGHPIRNYTPKEYQAFTQTWVCVQDKRGVIYIGSSSNILEYDGKTWRKIPVSKGVAVRSLYIDTAGVIYVGSVGEFGFLEPQRNGALVYKSLSVKLPEEQRKFSDVWSIQGCHGKVIFQTSENLFLYSDGKLNNVAPATSFSTVSFKIRGNFYVRQRKVGLMKLVDEKLHLVKEGEKLSDTPVLSVISYGRDEEERGLVLSGDSGFYLVDERKGTLQHMETKVEDFLNSAGVLGMKWLNDSIIYINTRIGLVFLDKHLTLQKVINKTDGLNDETVAEMFLDRQKELWLSTNNGISRISINSPLYYYNNSTGFSGSILAIVIHQNKILLGTSVGMFQAELLDQNTKAAPRKLNFSLIKGNMFEAWNFDNYGDELLAATSDGVFFVNGDAAERMTKLYANDVSRSLKDPEIIYVCEKEGIRLMRQEGKRNYKELFFFDLPADDILTAQEFNDASVPKGHTQVWLSTRSKGVLKLVYDENYKYKVSRYQAFYDLIQDQVHPIIHNGEIYFSSAKGVFTYDRSMDDGIQNCFKKSDLSININNNNGVHASSLNLVSLQEKDTQLGILAMEEAPYTFYQNNLDVLWIGLTNELVRFDRNVKKDYSIKYNTLIRKVVLGKDSLLFEGTHSFIRGDSRITSIAQDQDQIHKIGYGYNNITFEYAAPFFESEEKQNTHTSL